MITDSKKLHYHAVKSLAVLLRGKTSSHNRHFCCLICFHSHRTNNSLKKHERICNKHDYCYLEMPTEGSKTLKYNHSEKSVKAPFIITDDLEYILSKEHSCQNNRKNSYIERKAKHEPSGLIYSFDVTKNRHNVYRGKDYIEKFFEEVKKLAIETSKYREQEMIPLTDEETKFYEEQKERHVCNDICYDEKK